MNISIVCSDPKHPIFLRLAAWASARRAKHSVCLVTDVDQLTGGDVLFLISCTQIVPPAIRVCFGATLVIHASDLPQGRGWSPLAWQILEGKNRIAVSLLEAEDRIDSGRIWKKVWIEFAGTELFPEISERLFDVELQLMDYAVDRFAEIAPEPQGEGIPTYYRRRTPEDSRLDPERTLAEQFDLLRIADPERYPAFFEFRGRRYEVVIREKSE